MKFNQYILLTVVAALLPTGLQARPLFGPEVFVRTQGQPNDYLVSFSSNIEAPRYQILLLNGDSDGSHRVSSATIWLNGVKIFKANDFNQGVGELIRTVNIYPENEIHIRLGGAPGGFLAISVFGAVGAEGGVINSDSGIRLQIDPGILSTDVPISIESVHQDDLDIEVPAGLSFLGAVSLDLGDVRLTEEADLAIPITAPVSGTPIVSRIYEVQGVSRFVLTDTATILDDGLLHTNSPPYPGVRQSGIYAFLDMRSDLGIFGLTLKSPSGAPVEGRFLTALPTTLPDGETREIGKDSLEILSGFLGLSDETGFVVLPGLPQHSSIIATATYLNPSGAAEVDSLAVTVGAILTNGLLDTIVQEFVVGNVFGVQNLPTAPPTCSCLSLYVDPHTLPTPPDVVFSPGTEKQLTVQCLPSLENVRESDISDLPEILLQGLTGNVTIYLPENPLIASVTDDGTIKAESPSTNSTSVEIFTVTMQLAFIDNVIWPFYCLAAGAVQPIRVACPNNAPVWNASRRRCEALVTIHVSGNGQVTSSPSGISTCRSTCTASFPPGESVLFTATPDTGSSFDAWSGACSGDVNTFKLSVSSGDDCTANFKTRELHFLDIACGVSYNRWPPRDLLRVRVYGEIDAEFEDYYSIHYNLAPGAGAFSPPDWYYPIESFRYVQNDTTFGSLNPYSSKGTAAAYVVQGTKPYEVVFRAYLNGELSDEQSVLCGTQPYP